MMKIQNFIQNRFQLNRIIRLLLIPLFGIVGITSVAGQAINIVDYVTPGSFTYTVPNGVTELVVECWGGGGGGSAAIGMQLETPAPGAGGGGGAHSHSVIKVTPGQTLYVIVGAGGAGGISPYNNDGGEGQPGQKTIVRNANGEELVVADGGRGATFRRLIHGGSRGGDGGGYIGSKGTVIHTGGKGADAGTNYSGAGGGAGGRTHEGYNADGINAGSAGSCYCGIPGAGGAGRNTTGTGNPGINTINPNRGVVYSGGGGGGGFDEFWHTAIGGKGANGHIRIKEQQVMEEIKGTPYMEVGETIQLTPPFSGGEWRSSLVEIATVDSTGLVKGLSVGETIITYSRGNFLSNQSTEFHLFVYPKGQSISITGLRSYCANGTNHIDLEASNHMGGDVFWYWTGPNGFTSATAGFIRPATEANAGTYTVTASRLATGTAGQNLIINGDFERGNSGFTSNYRETPHSQNGEYYVGTKPIVWGFSGCDDHTSGIGNYISLRGTPKTGRTLWKQTVNNLKPNTNYQFTYWMQSMQYAQTPIPQNLKIQAQIAGKNIGAVFSKESSKTCHGWTGFVYNWNSGTNTSAEISLNLHETMSEDFQIGLDDISLREIDSGEFAVITANVEVQIGTSFVPKIKLISTPEIPLVGKKNTFLASTEFAGLDPTYKWYVNGLVVSADKKLITYTSSTLKEGDKVMCELIPDIGCAMPGPFYSDIITVQGSDKNYWLGYTSSQWFVIDNWTKLRVPFPMEDVEFATLENSGKEAQRDLETTEPEVTIKDYINKTDKKLIIAPETSLTITGNIDTNDENKILIQASDGMPNGSLIIPNTTAPLATVEMWSKAWIENEAASDNKMKWQYFGIPVTNLSAAAPTFSGAYVREYDEVKATTTPGSQWNALNGSSAMAPFAGYEITQPQPKKYSISGTLVKERFSKVLSVTNNSYYKGQHIFSNPYSAAIDINKMSFGSALDSTIYLYNTGSYAEWTEGVRNSGLGGSYTAVPQHQATTMGINIPSMQGFLVRVLKGEGSEIDRTLSFDYSAVVKNTNSLRSAVNKTYLKATLVSNHYTDQAWLFEESHCTTGFDNGWDGFKLFSSAVNAQFYITGKGENYQVSSTDSIEGTCFGFHAGEKDTIYKLLFETKNLSLQYDSLFLIDLETGIATDLLLTDSVTYEFTAVPGIKTTERFKITSNPAKDTIETTLNGISVYVNNQTVYVNNQNTEAGQFIIYDLQGRMVSPAHKFAANTLTATPVSLMPGIYIIKLTTGKKEKMTKVIYR
ncbi:glycine-rich domain-containing protein [Massilibacteroides vaginae]|uniref:glycine-rich domain-containing protein n=1 Tax=Massilibacteroides vaginae TaxID=1673718 RepID=UPI00111C26EE|nr:T9SS type A sorting domain-containing protein [Massilibacteroides vaginae]